jgi:sugar lactone lactonase YvrE
MAIDAQDRLFIVYKAARLQVFDRKGEFSHGWRTPDWEFGKPTGLSFDNDGNLMVADTHYYRILFYTPEGELLEDKTIGGVEGQAPGQFGWVTDAVQDSSGHYYVSEYGELDRVQKFSPSGEYLWGWGGHGDGPLEFKRPQNLAIDEDDNLWVVDACNHRVLVFDVSGTRPKLLKNWGELGSDPGQLRYPYDLVVDEKYVYICEFGNHRVQKFTRDGQFVGLWGSHGRNDGELHNPWSIVKDSKNRLHILDTYNQRVQRIRL